VEPFDRDDGRLHLLRAGFKDDQWPRDEQILSEREATLASGSPWERYPPRRGPIVS
jgi:hypothetical protein